VGAGTPQAADTWAEDMAQVPAARCPDSRSVRTPPNRTRPLRRIDSKRTRGRIYAASPRAFVSYADAASLPRSGMADAVADTGLRMGKTCA
jgi:hypothetical protein